MFKVEIRTWVKSESDRGSESVEKRVFFREIDQKSSNFRENGDKPSWGVPLEGSGDRELIEKRAFFREIESKSGQIRPEIVEHRVNPSSFFREIVENQSNLERYRWNFVNLIKSRQNGVFFLLRHC